MQSTISGFKTPSGIMTPGWATGIATGASGSATDLDLMKIGQARTQLVDMKLNQVG